MKFDTLFIKNKILVKTLEEYTNTYRSLSKADSPDIMDEKTLWFLSKKIDNLCKKDMRSINKAFRLINRQRRKWIKAGAIDTEDEMFEFMYQIGLYNPEMPDEPAETNPEAEKETPTDKPENAAETAKEESENKDEPEARTEENGSDKADTEGQEGGNPFIGEKEGR